MKRQTKNTLTLDPHPGFEIKQMRREALMTQGQLAKLAGMTRTEICRIEQGQAEPRGRTLMKLRVILKNQLRNKHESYRVTILGRRGRDYLALGQTFGFFKIEKL